MSKWRVDLNAQKITIKSKDFKKYLLILEIYICKYLQINKKVALITLDNSPVHILKISKLAANQLSLNNSYQPQYSPAYAPVELVFGPINRRIVEELLDKVINFDQNL